MPDAQIEEVKQIAGQLAKTFEEFKAANDARLDELEKKGKSDVLTTEKVDRLNKELDDLQQKMKDAAKTSEKVSEMEKRLARPGQKDGKDTIDPQEEKYFAGFTNYLRKGDDRQLIDISRNQNEFKNVLNHFEQKDGMAIVGDATGGFMVPPTWANRVVAKQYETTPMRKYATVMTTTGDSIEFPTDPSDIGGGWVGETDARPVTSGLTPGKDRIDVQEVYAMPKLTQKLLDDNGFNLEAYLSKRITDKLARLQNAAFITGDGIKSPRGITTYTTSTADDSSRAWGTVQVFGTGVSGDFAASNPGDILSNVVGSLKAPLQAGSNWFMPRSVQAKIRQFKTSALGYIWEPSLVAGAPDKLLGYPVELAQDMPALAANSLSLAFGNFGEAYTIVDRMGIRMLRDNLTVKGYVLFYTTQRVGGGVVNSEAYKLVKFG